ncbi:hypothetical protein MBLNU230_g2193t1 [Neophaeotheca triangularis]
MATKTMATRRLFSGAFQIRCYSAPAEKSIPPAKQKYVPTSGTYPKGFVAGSAFAGVKPSNTKYDDLAVVASETPASAALVTTRNVFKAAPVTLSKQMVAQPSRSRDFRGVVVNSGCANAVTGKEGYEDALAMSKAAEKHFAPSGGNKDAHHMLVMSTGVIGQRLPIDKITSNIPKLHTNCGETHEHWLNAARAICTTDTFPKLLSRTFTLPSHPETTYSIAGMTKGAGMIHPNMGTLLGILCTDVSLEQNSSVLALRRATNLSFNAISIDGDTSTNDAVALFANGATTPTTNPSTNPIEFTRDPDEQQSADATAFESVLSSFMTDLAKLVVRDGEGATKFVTIRVRGDNAASKQNPRSLVTRVAKSIATSSLVKTALYGKDANWGRILCAIGYAPGIKRGAINPERTSVSFVPADGSAELPLLVRGEPEKVDEVRAKEILEMEDLEILVRLDDDGPETSEKWDQEAVVWTCDFSHEYVTINGDYRT